MAGSKFIFSLEDSFVGPELGKLKASAAPNEYAVGVVGVPGLEDDEPCTGEEDEQEELLLDREASLFAIALLTLPNNKNYLPGTKPLPC